MFRWISSIAAALFGVVFSVGEITGKPVLEAVSLVALFIDFFLIAIKTRCPCCNRALRLYPPLLCEEEFCPYCGSKIE